MQTSSSSTASGSKTVFVPQSEKSDKGMKSKTDLVNSKSFVKPHVCHHCGVSGQIRPNCFKLYPYKQLSKRSQVSPQGPIPFVWRVIKSLELFNSISGEFKFFYVL